MSSSNGHYIPNNPEAEKAVLGSLLRENNLIPETMAVVGREHFYLGAHQQIFQAIVDLYVEESSPADPVTLMRKLEERGQLEETRAKTYLVELWDAAPAAGRVLHYAKIVRERAFHRRLIHTWQELQELSIQPAAKPAEIVETAREKIAEFFHFDALGAAPPKSDADNLAWKAFPLSLLPPTLRSFIEYASESIMVDPGMLILPVVCTVGGVIGNRYTVRVKADWTEPAIFWGAIVARSSAKKTPCFNAATKPVRDIQNDLQTRYVADNDAYEWSSDEYQEARKQCDTAEQKKALGKPPRKPTLERLLVSNVTVERCFDLLSENPGGLLLAMDELAGFLGSFERYRAAGAGSDRPQWLEMFHGNQVTYDRRGGEKRTLIIPRAVLSIVGTTQPHILAELFSSNAYHSGLAPRFLLSYPPKRPRVWSDTEIPEEVRASYHKLIAALQSDHIDDVQKAGWRPREVSMTAEARDYYRKFYDQWGKVQDAAEGPEEYAFAKLEAYGPRFALLLAVVEAQASGAFPEVTVQHVERAEALVRWFAGEAMRTYKVLRSGGHAGPEEAMVDWVRSNGGRATVRDVQRSKHGRSMEASEIRLLFERLAKTNRATLETVPAKGEGGRPSVQLVLSQLSLGRDNCDSDKTPP